MDGRRDEENDQGEDGRYEKRIITVKLVDWLRHFEEDGEGTYRVLRLFKY